MYRGLYSNVCHLSIASRSPFSRSSSYQQIKLLRKKNSNPCCCCCFFYFQRKTGVCNWKSNVSFYTRLCVFVLFCYFLKKKIRFPVHAFKCQFYFVLAHVRIQQMPKTLQTRQTERVHTKRTRYNGGCLVINWVCLGRGKSSILMELRAVLIYSILSIYAGAHYPDFWCNISALVFSILVNYYLQVPFNVKAILYASKIP